MDQSNVNHSAAESMFSVKTASSASVQFEEEAWYASLRASLEYWHEAVVSDHYELMVCAQVLVIRFSTH